MHWASGQSVWDWLCIVLQSAFYVQEQMSSDESDSLLEGIYNILYESVYFAHHLWTLKKNDGEKSCAELIMFIYINRICMCETKE